MLSSFGGRTNSPLLQLFGGGEQTALNFTRVLLSSIVLSVITWVLSLGIGWLAIIYDHYDAIFSCKIVKFGAIRLLHLQLLLEIL